LNIEIPEHARKEAIASIQRYFDRNLPEPIGDLPAGMLLDFFLQDIAPVVYNKAVSDAQTRVQARIAEVDGELYEVPFQYWHRLEKKRKPR
jgi:uncharacterized protein (DUF2164 family)